jgi:cytochrome c-type biogenesis protein CcmH
MLFLAWPPAIALAATPRASLTDVEDQVMCVSCHTPLAVSESPQGEAERDYIRMLIAQGETKSQILNNLVAQYGPAVLALPRARGFNLTVYILPPAVVLAAAVALAWSLPRWRRRTAAAAAARGDATVKVDPSDAARLDAELAKFGR